MKEIILKMLKELKPEQNFIDSENYIEEGILDSFDIIELISMLEEQFNVIIDGMDILPEYFSNVEQIEKLVRKSSHNE
jgi:acyl carrier protein